MRSSPAPEQRSASGAGVRGPDQIAGIRQSAAGRVGNDQRGGLLAAQLLQFAHGLLHGLFGAAAPNFAIAPSSVVESSSKLIGTRPSAS
jgi:hypothetical protein